MNTDRCLFLRLSVKQKCTISLSNYTQHLHLLEQPWETRAGRGQDSWGREPEAEVGGEYSASQQGMKLWWVGVEQLAQLEHRRRGGRNASAGRDWVAAECVWRMGEGSVLGVWPQVGLVQGVDLCWGAGLKGAAWEWLSLHTPAGAIQAEGLLPPAGARPCSFDHCFGNRAKEHR